MARELARKSLPYVESEREPKPRSVGIPLARTLWLRFVLVLVLLSSMVGLGVFQIRLHSDAIKCQEEISSLTRSIDQATLENEGLRKEVERLSSPSRLYQEGERLGMKPADEILKLKEF
jgi:cell division protein FtsL